MFLDGGRKTGGERHNDGRSIWRTCAGREAGLNGSRRLSVFRC
jgi:hypothetical protein